MSKEYGTMALKDIEAFEVMLENAEILYEHFTENGVTTSIELENGMVFNFDNDGKLESIG